LQQAQAGCWQHDRDFVLHDTALVATPTVELFDPRWWQAQDRVEGSFDGRAKVLVVRDGDARWVLRRYRRGGLVSKIANDTYVWGGLARTRPWREWQLLAQLRARGLPVPRPVAAHVHRSGWRYGGHILTELLEGTRPMVDALDRGDWAQEDWRRLGETLRRFRDAGVHHPDLNVRNILVGSDGRIHLIDFDKGRLGSDATQWRRDLQRFRRSIDKHHAIEDADWQTLVDVCG
jgi:3-deoxy-D-manno-octulosonic acid kinase